MSRVWEPRAEDVPRTHMAKFMQQINKKHTLNLQTYEDLFKYSVTMEQFWLDLSEYMGLKYITPPDCVLEGSASLKKALHPPTQFFPGATMNYAENCLTSGDPEQVAVISVTEGASDISRCTFRELKARVHQLSDSLRELGIVKGDRVAGVLTNSLTTVVVIMAVASLGAVYSSSATDLGEAGILDRLTQIAPKVIFFDNACHYNGKDRELVSRARNVLAGIDSDVLKAMIVIPNLPHLTSTIDHAKALTLQSFQDKYCRRSPELSYEPTSFMDPLFVMYSSGTTGPPKCIVHSAGGVLLQMRKEFAMHMNLHKGDVFWQYTTTGWMMYQYQITALAAGATILCYDGSPLVNVPGLIRLMDDEKVTHFGTSPRWLTEVDSRSIHVKELAALKDMRCVTSTGSLLMAEQFYSFYKNWPAHIQLASISGGTDILGCFFHANQISPVYAGQLQCRVLGMACAVYDDAGNEVLTTRTPGELVCTRPFPSQPVYFLSDPDGAKYRAAYYERFPGIWHHSDYVQFEENGGIVMLGRSDGVLNPSGVRFGSSEIYTVTDRFAEVVDSLCIGQRRPNDIDESVVLFLVTKTPGDFTDALVSKVKKAILKELSPRHGMIPLLLRGHYSDIIVPKYIFYAPGIPMTINGKKVEIVVKRILSGENPKVSSTVANPDILEYYYPFYKIEEAAKGSAAK